jgi:methylmalonyl-CoA mutase
MAMSDFLFKEFSEVSAKQWKQKVQFDLKGADYNETLVWESNEGIKVRPFYHQDEAELLEIPSVKDEVKNCQSIFISEEKTANFLAKDALKRGATSIEFQANEPFDIEQLLLNVTLSLSTPLKTSSIEGPLQIHFKLNFLSESFLSDLIEQTKEYKVFLNIDIIGNLAKNGNWFFDHKKDHAILENILKKTSPSTSVISVDTSLYQNAGANIVQQVAYALAHANEYLNHLDKSNIILSENEESIQFHFAIGSNYFFEIAKLRAFRYLWNILCDEYGLKNNCSVFVQPSLRNKTLYDYNVNMLRTTTECMSAVLGGATTFSNVSYDTIYHRKNEFGERIARNQLLILQEESYFKEAAAFADGSYYIESLTIQIAEKALELFKDIEKSGGFLKQLSEGTIQRKIEDSAQKEQERFDTGKEILLGTNKHPNLTDKMKEDIELYPFVRSKPRKTIIRPIIAKRLAEKQEQERLEIE